MEKKKKGKSFISRKRSPNTPSPLFPSIISVAMNVKKSVWIGNIHVEHRKFLRTLHFLFHKLWLTIKYKQMIKTVDCSWLQTLRRLVGALTQIHLIKHHMSLKIMPVFPLLNKKIIINTPLFFFFAWINQLVGFCFFVILPTASNKGFVNCFFEEMFVEINYRST